MMDPRTGLLPGQSWNVAPGGAWQARLCREGRAHVIGRELAGHPVYDEGYTDPRRVFATAEPRVAGDYRRLGMRVPRFARPRPWHTFERACRAARMHERIVIAAKRQEQGGDA